MALFLQAVADGLQMGLLYALVAVGLAIIWGLMETITAGRPASPAARRQHR